MTTSTYDVIVIGAGPAGENAAQYAIADSDRTAVLIESELVGGECSYWACMPSKALLKPGHVLAAAQAMPGVREALGSANLDAKAVLERRDSFTHNHNDESQVHWAENTGIDVLRGSARLTGVRTVEVDGRTLTARDAVVIATGTSAAIPNTPGLADALPWTSRDVTNMHEIPQRVLVIGGGVVACEAATWLLSLGVSELTMVVRGDRLLASAEPFAGDRVADALRAHGARILFGANVTQVRRADPEARGEGCLHGGEVSVEVADERLTVDEIIVATGRKPRSHALGLDAVGLEPGRYLDVDDQLTVRGVDGDWLYAVGDINGRSPLTHMGKYQARVCGDVIAARAQGLPLDHPRCTARADHGEVPQVVFTDPEVAWVGRTEKAARSDGFTVATVELDIAVAGSSLDRDDYSGRAKLVVDTASDTLLGATFVGPDVGELVHAATIAVVGKVPLDALWHAVPAYPTVSEVWLRLLEQYRRAPLSSRR
ncbi:NAD(P)/FAD-dependent oxidoreductase [Skermania sp. ID1734]|uniref:dihydrolipoyl dehydrogenase family protein n=1 Tax=Skermania sp. ID1734 TaxID=2597516 RepID=UPI00117CA258|nr:NAD(P)/FAD-dependent oxidoreductase [Skermania sp. ID1734]TSD99675.1 NAD(P)/FAD-dependent oxidoreductase [Skermania sp. ID1734]